MTTITTQIIKVGRREFDYDTFANAVKQTKTFSELCEHLGMNKTVQTTINALKDRVSELNLDTSHFIFKYNITDKVLQAAQNNSKQFNIQEVNNTYYKAFEQSFSDRPASWAQYKVHCGDFLQKLGNKDFATITVQEIENFVDSWNASEKTKANCKAHIRSMLIYIIKENIGGAAEKVSRDVLVWLI